MISNFARSLILLLIFIFFYKVAYCENTNPADPLNIKLKTSRSALATLPDLIKTLQESRSLPPVVSLPLFYLLTKYKNEHLIESLIKLENYSVFYSIDSINESWLDYIFTLKSQLRNSIGLTMSEYLAITNFLDLYSLVVQRILFRNYIRGLFIDQKLWLSAHAHTFVQNLKTFNLSSAIPIDKETYRKGIELEKMIETKNGSVRSKLREILSLLYPTKSPKPKTDEKEINDIACSAFLIVAE